MAIWSSPHLYNHLISILFASWSPCKTATFLLLMARLDYSCPINVLSVIRVFGFSQTIVYAEAYVMAESLQSF